MGFLFSFLLKLSYGIIWDFFSGNILLNFYRIFPTENSKSCTIFYSIFPIGYFIWKPKKNTIEYSLGYFL